MAISSAICNTFKRDLLKGFHDFDSSGGDTFKIALYTSSATLGDEVAFIDPTGYFANNELTINRNSHKIQGVANNLVVTTERAGFTLVYYNATQGWVLKDRG